jgi:hypothetical protein
LHLCSKHAQSKAQRFARRRAYAMMLISSPSAAATFSTAFLAKTRRRLLSVSVLSARVHSSKCSVAVLVLLAPKVGERGKFDNSVLLFSPVSGSMHQQPHCTDSHSSPTRRDYTRSIVCIGLDFCSYHAAYLVSSRSPELHHRATTGLLHFQSAKAADPALSQSHSQNNHHLLRYSRPFYPLTSHSTWGLEEAVRVVIWISLFSHFALSPLLKSRALVEKNVIWPCHVAMGERASSERLV